MIVLIQGVFHTHFYSVIFLNFITFYFDDLEINNGINDGCLWVLHGSDVDLHVGEADQQDLEQQDLSNLVGRDRGLSCWL